MKQNTETCETVGTSDNSLGRLCGLCRWIDGMATMLGSGFYRHGIRPGISLKSQKPGVVSLLRFHHLSCISVCS